MPRSINDLYANADVRPSARNALMFAWIDQDAMSRLTVGRWKSLWVRLFGKKVGPGWWRYRGRLYMLKENPSDAQKG